LSLLGCPTQNHPKTDQLTELQGSALGSTWCVKVLTKQIFKEDELRNEIIQKIEDAEKIFSHWRPDSELYRFNTSENTLPFSIPQDLHDLLKHAEWMHQHSQGAFDPTLGPVVNLWGFGPPGHSRSTIPTDLQIDEALEQTGIKNVKFLPNRFIQKKVPTLQLDLSGSAKGEIIDLVCSLLDRWNFNNYLVEIGGEVRAFGKGRKGNGWLVGLENGSREPHTLASIPLRNYAVATSGTYRLNKPNPQSSRKASHLIDPRTGHPIENTLIAVNAFAPTARDADAWATALMILGLKDAMKKAEELNIVARFCESKKEKINISYSSAYRRLFLSENR
jgi:thiamine biosynthesis lipoprotein